MTYIKEDARNKIQKLAEDFRAEEERRRLVAAVMSTVGGSDD
jgi:hypothetical protein